MNSHVSNDLDDTLKIGLFEAGPARQAEAPGEYFIRNVVAYDVSALMEYKGMTLEQATSEVVMKKLKEQSGEGGLIAIDAKGNIAMPFNTPGMYRAYMLKDGKSEVKIYKE